MTVLDCMWLPAPATPVLPNDEVHVWCAALDRSASQIQRLAQTLSPEEHNRAERFYFEKDRKHFIVARGLLRTILGGYLGIEPSQLQFCYGSHGKPALAEIGGESRLRFNLSHSHGLALYAIARDREVGIDLEQIRPLDTAEQLAKRFFSVREHAVLRRLTGSQQQEAFFHYWTCKEAYLKATGDGLAKPLDQIEVSLAPGKPAKLLRIADNPLEASRWCLQQLMPVSGYVAALAVEGRGWRIACWQWPQ